MIWTLKNLVEFSSQNLAHINGKWVPCRPENGKRKYATMKMRIRAAWMVFNCKAEAFTWPEGQ